MTDVSILIGAWARCLVWLPLHLSRVCILEFFLCDLLGKYALLAGKASSFKREGILMPALVTEGEVSGGV